MATVLSESWGVDVAQARYREDGTWYDMLQRFPAALFDAHGYVLFQTEVTLRSTPGVQTGKQITIRKGISSLLGYVRRLAVGVGPAVTFYADEVHAPKTFWEGVLRRVMVNAFERSDDARGACIEHFGASCRVCKVDFEARYGQIGRGFIHVHHLRPLREIRDGYIVNPKRT